MFARSLAALSLVFLTASCSLIPMPVENDRQMLRKASLSIGEIKAFVRELGIEPTQALTKTIEQKAPTSMLWFWMQRAGTLALSAPIDVRLAIGFSEIKEKVPLEQVYRVDGYSVYYRQGNEFADSRSVTTPSFAREAAVRRVAVVIHEDLHGDGNFDLPWEIEESLITPLGALASLEFFKRRGDLINLQAARALLDEERQLSRELNQLVAVAERIFRDTDIDRAKQKIAAMIPAFPIYERHFQRQIAGQHPGTVIEAKLSHDLAYYRHYDRIVGLYERNGDLQGLVRDLRRISKEMLPHEVTAYLVSLEQGKPTVAARLR